MEPTTPSLKALVGDATYGVWLETLRRLVPDGRTERLSVVIGSMLHFALDVASDTGKKTSEAQALARLLSDAAEEGDPDTVAKLLLPTVRLMFDDAGVAYERRNAKGVPYSVADAAFEEFVRWYYMPWD